MPSPVATLVTLACDADGEHVALPRPEIQLVARFGAAAHGGVDVHALGVRETAHRKRLRRGQRAVTARLRLGAAAAVLGVPASAIAGRVVALEDLWGDAAARRLRDELADAPSDAAATLERAIRARFDAAGGCGAYGRFAEGVAERLATADVRAVAAHLDVSERHLRRVFRDAVGVSPKAFAKLTRFHRALHAARSGPAGWADVAAAAGYYDHAHLIGEFRAIAGATPRDLLGELSSRPAP